jgi:hypothetical protein
VGYQSDNVKDRDNQQERVKMNRKILDKSTLTSLLDDYGSVDKVAAHLSIPYSTLYAWYKKYGITLPPSCMTIYNELRSVEFTKTQKSVILGSILGDGSLIKQKSSKNARLQMGHCTKQLHYLNWKVDLLNPFCKSKPVLAEKPGDKIICGKKSYSSGYYIANTIAHPDMTKYYNKYYFGGNKRVHVSVIDEIDELALAIWLADDGSFTFRKDCKYSLRGSIATCSFYRDETELLLLALSRFYGGHAGIGKDGGIYMSGTYHLNKLLDIVTNILPKSIHYKLAPQRLIRKAP